MSCLALSVNLYPIIVSLFKTANRVSTADFRLEKTSKITKTRNQNKAQEYDDFSVRMLEICGSLLKSLCLLFINCVRHRIFPNICKMTNVLPKHQKQQTIRKQLSAHTIIINLFKND